MKIKVSQATNLQLDWMVAKCEGFVQPQPIDWILGKYFTPSTNWAQGGPIIEREGITVIHMGDDWVDEWQARRGDGHWQGDLFGGSTPLDAAMRCYVISDLGDAVEVPDEVCS